jgi:hypothetical protein
MLLVEGDAMRLLRAMAGALLWIGAALVGLVGCLLCLTLVLLPLGLPLLALARRMFTASVRFMLPRNVAHPGREARRAARRKRDEALDVTGGAVGKMGRKTRKAIKKQRKKLR